MITHKTVHACSQQFYFGNSVKKHPKCLSIGELLNCDLFITGNATQQQKGTINTRNLDGSQFMLEGEPIIKYEVP